MQFGLKRLAIRSLLAAFLALPAACGSDGPATGIPFRSAIESKVAAQKKFDEWWRATQDRDGSGMYALLARNIMDCCTLAQFEQTLATDDDAFITPELDVKLPRP